MNKDDFKYVRQQLSNLRKSSDLEAATFAGGCFWCLEGPLEAIDGVEEVITGFAGGEEIDPTYDEVVSGLTGHREAAQVFYDPKTVSYRELLKAYFWQIEPTDEGGQFADRGFHYTTAVFYHDKEQKKEAEIYIEELLQSGRYNKQIVTEVIPFTTFYPAEDYHQDFYKKRAEYYKSYAAGSGREGYINAMKNISAKVEIED